eukprot:scaffold8153_cov41-Attheya_sp.AAC.2
MAHTNMMHTYASCPACKHAASQYCPFTLTMICWRYPLNFHRMLIAPVQEVSIQVAVQFVVDSSDNNSMSSKVPSSIHKMFGRMPN